MRTRTCLVFSSLLLASLAFEICEAQEGKQSAGQRPSVSPDDRTEDRAAIRRALDLFAKTFEERDAKALAAHFTAEGEFQTVYGETLRGREALQRAFAELFTRTPEVKAEIRPDSLRFLSGNTAIGEGTVTVQRGPAEPATSALYSALVVREDEAWRLAHLSESPVEEETSIADIVWLIGQWKSAGGGGVEIQTTYSWAPGKKFLRMEFTRKDKDLALSGSQVIGVDPATGMLHSWTFEADGGVGEADWRRDGDHWVLDAAGTLADGSRLVETNVLRRVSEDAFTWQSVNRMLDDADLADLPPVKVTRVKN